MIVSVTPELTEVAARQVLQNQPERSVSADGLELNLRWRRTVGATDAVVEAAWIDLVPVSEHDIGDSVAASMQPSGKHFDIVLDGPARPIRTVRLNGLKAAGVDRELKSQVDISGLGVDLPGPAWRLCVAADQGGGFGLVQYAVPFIGRKGQRPAIFSGASFDGRVLSLPDVVAKGLRVTLMRGELPEDLAEQEALLSGASVRVAPGPVDLEASDGSGPLWSVPGAFSDSARIDLKNSVERSLGETPAAASASLTLRGKSAGRLHTAGIAANGYLLRNFPDKVQASFEGDRQAFPLGELDARAPTAASADVTIVHEGLRLHALSAAVPAESGGLSGRVVGAAQVVHALPPRALRGEALVRVGVVGFGTGGTLTLRILDAAGEQAGGPLADGFAEAAVTATAGGDAPGVTWLELPKPLVVDRSISIELTASERFLWVEESAAPLMRFAVACEPQGLVTIAGKAFTVAGERTDLTGQALPTASFAGGPVLAVTDQFCRLTLSNLLLRYAP